MSGPSTCTVGTTPDYASGKHTVTPSTAAAFHWMGFSLGHVSHSVLLRCLGLTIAVVLLLAFVERPSSLSLSSDPRRRSTHLNPPCGATESVELLCLIIFCLDLAVKVNTAEWANTIFDYMFNLRYISRLYIQKCTVYSKLSCCFLLCSCISLSFFLFDPPPQSYLIGWEEFKKNKWLISYMVVISVSFIDWMLSVSMVCDEVRLCSAVETWRRHTCNYVKELFCAPWTLKKIYT